MPLLERDIERYLVRRAIEHGGKAYKWVSPGHVGVADRIQLMGIGFAFRCASLMKWAHRSFRMDLRPVYGPTYGKIYILLIASNLVVASSLCQNEEFLACDLVTKRFVE